jgi:Flp pilus assembly protein TadD
MAEVYLLVGDEKKAFENLQLAKRGGIDVAAVEALILERTGDTREVAVDDLVEQAQAYFRSGDLETARSLLERAARSGAEDARVPYWRGRVATVEGDDERARAQFERALAVEADYQPARYELGRFAYEREDFPAAVRWLEPYVEAGRADSSALFMLGRSELETGAPREAETHLRAALRIRADDGSFFYFLGLALLAQGRDEEARHELEMAAESRSIPELRRNDAHLRLARLLEAAGEREEAEGHVAAALRSSAPETVAVPGTDHVALVRVEPPPSRVLPRGEPVRIAVTFRFGLATAERGAVLLVPQDEGGTPLLRPQPRATVRRGTGEVTLEARVTTPAAGAHLDVFLVLHPEGQRTSTAGARARFALE